MKDLKDYKVKAGDLIELFEEYINDAQKDSEEYEGEFATRAKYFKEAFELAKEAVETYARIEQIKGGSNENN